jgi:crotonobetainyl-CoA:carnitine CoA-transferase CaiB-like acyl-CoA transferase
MAAEGIADDFILNYDWDTFNMMSTEQEVLEKIAEPTRRLFMSHTKKEILEGALKHNAQVYPLASVAEIADNPQLKARDYWVELEHPELGTSITYPGSFAKSTESPPVVYRRAPLIGEHNEEIYLDEMGIPEDELVKLKQEGIV